LLSRKHWMATRAWAHVSVGAHVPDLTCESAGELAGGDAAVPRMAPRVTGVQVQGVRRVLALCRKNGRGEPYRSDFAVTRVGGSLVPVDPVFWFDVRVADPGVNQVAQALPPGSPPESCDP
jgi:hypothetical protein